MRFLVLSLIISIIYLSACQSDSSKSAAPTADTTYTLKGKIAGIDSGWAYLRHRESEDPTTDSVPIKNGEFVFTGKAPVPEFCNVGFNTKGKKDYYFGFFLQNGNLSLSGKADSLTDQAINITGSPSEDDFKNFMEQGKSLEAVNTKIDNAYEAAHKKKDQKLMDSLVQEYQKLEKEHQQLVKNYALTHPHSYPAAFEVYSDFSFDADPKPLDSIYNNFDSSVRVSYFGKAIRELSDIAKKTAVGVSAPEFTQNDATGKPISLSSFKGRYVLIDFWASWCGPCRGENPNVVKAYKKFHPKGFDILGVSLDDEKDKWIEAIKNDKLDWTQVSDLHGWKNGVAELYGVKAIPTNFLLDKDGKIIAKGLRGDILESKLTETLKN